MQRLKKLRKECGYTQGKLAEKLNVARSTVSMYELGASEPDMQTLRRMASLFNVTIDYLLELSNDKQTKRGTKIPVYCTLPKDFTISKIDEQYITEYIEYSDNKNCFGYKQNDDSMSPVILKDDIVIANYTNSCKSGDYCIVRINDNDIAVRKVIINTKGYTLQPINSAHTPIFFTTSEIHNKDIEICGIIKQVRREYK